MSMIDNILYSVLALSFLALIVCVWGLVCNNRTCNQRIHLVKSRPRDLLFWDYSREYEAVSYDRHMYALMLFRNPRLLYGELTRELWK